MGVDDKKWGLKSMGGGTAAYFKIDGSSFSAEVVDSGSFSVSTALVWNHAWSSAATRFGLILEPGLVSFLVEGSVIAEVGIGGGTFNNQKVSPWFYNGNPDNFDIKWIAGNGLRGYHEPIV